MHHALRNRIDERVTGYNVTYDYQGRRYMTQTTHPPGDRIPVSVDVRPAVRRAA